MTGWLTHLLVQVQVGELSIADGGLFLTVHGEVNLAAVAFDGDVVPVLVVQNVTHSHRGATIHLVNCTASYKTDSTEYYHTSFIYSVSTTV